MQKLSKYNIIFLGDDMKKNLLYIFIIIVLIIILVIGIFTFSSLNIDTNNIQNTTNIIDDNSKIIGNEIVFPDRIVYKDENYKVRLSCADALGRLGDRYAVTSLMSVASDESEKSVYVRESATTALGLIGDMRAVDSLVKILETKTGIMDKFTYLKEKAVEALCRLTPGDGRAFKALKKSLDDENPQVRINAIEALMDYDTQEALELIRGMLTDRDDEVKQNAVIALYNINGEDELNRIINSAQYGDICKEEARRILEEEQDD